MLIFFPVQYVIWVYLSEYKNKVKTEYFHRAMEDIPFCHCSAKVTLSAIQMSLKGLKWI